MSREVYQPPSISVLRTGDSLVITRSWYRNSHLVVAGMCLFWDSLSLLVTLQIAREGLHWAILLGSCLNLAIAALLTYYTLVGFLNRTRLIVADGRFTVRHGPIPWTSPGLELAVTDLAQVFVIEQLGWDGGRYFQLCSVLKDGSKVMLLSALGTQPELAFIEETLESYLHLEDAPVESEYE